MNWVGKYVLSQIFQRVLHPSFRKVKFFSTKYNRIILIAMISFPSWCIVNWNSHIFFHHTFMIVIVRKYFYFGLKCAFDFSKWIFEELRNIDEIVSSCLTEMSPIFVFEWIVAILHRSSERHIHMLDLSGCKFKSILTLSKKSVRNLYFM